MYTASEENLIVLSSFKEMGYELKKLLLSDFNSDVPDFANYFEKLIKSSGTSVYNKVKALFFDKEYRKSVLDGLDKKGVKCVTYFSESYPENLKNIPSPPVMLYAKGDVNLLKTNCFSIVGSRRTQPQALSRCKKIAAEAGKVFTVVSGLADGADSAALSGALSSGAKVISVLANGFDNIYPACNLKLSEQIAENGLLVSEYPPDECAKKYNFPVRNRIIAGLSKGTLVVSAGKKSGALITADYAAEYGRDVFAFPYSLDDPTGEGCNGLIKKGAYLTENILDIFTELGVDFKPYENSARSFTADEKRIYDCILSQGTVFIPALSESLGVPAYKLMPVVTSLVIKGCLVNCGGNRYGAIK